MSDLDKAIEMAAKISARVASALSPLDREMTLMGWPPDLQKIMWEAVAAVAARCARDVSHPTPVNSKE